MNLIPKSLVKKFKNIRGNAVSRVIRFSWCLKKILNSVLKIKTLVRSLLLLLYLICIRLEQ